MTELKDKELVKVAGGSTREKTIVVRVDYEDVISLSGDVKIEPYLNGELLSDQVKTVDCCITSVNISVKGKEGYADLKVKINNTISKNYTLNFDKGSYIEY